MAVLITGVAGQDGLILAHFLKKQGVCFEGVCRDVQVQYVQKAIPNFTPINVDLSIKGNISSILRELKPTKIFNFAGFSSVKDSWQYPELTFSLNTQLPKEIINWIINESPETSLLQATSSEIFAGSLTTPQNESTTLSPLSPYGVSKAKTHEYLQEAREKFGLKLSSAIMYNHESPIRSPEFVTRHISKSIAGIALGQNETLQIGNMNSIRDWGWAPDYVEVLVQYMNLDVALDFIVSTGIPLSVAALIEYGFQSIGISDYAKYVSFDEQRIRSVDSQVLTGKSRILYDLLAWRPKVTIENGISKMVENDIKLLMNPQLKNPLEWLLDEYQ